MDYTYLNEACPKDNFPLPRIDQIVDDVGLAWDVVVLGCLLGISSNTHVFARRGKNSIHHPARAVMLQCDAV